MPIDVIGVLLRTENNINPGYSSGFQLRGLFYRMLGSLDPEFSERIHEFRGLAPFSISPLMKLDPRTYMFRVTSYLTRLSSVLIESFSMGDEIRLMDRRFRIVEISFKRLELEKLMEDSRPHRKYELEFLSPTCFRRPYPYIPLHYLGFFARLMKMVGRPKSHYRFLPLPDPILMLRNLRRQWEQYAGMSLKVRGFARWLEEGGVAVSGVDGVKTHRIVNRVRGRFFVGFTGRVRLSLPGDVFREDAARTVDLLLRVGEETQVGINRTAGFGMYRILRAAGHEAS